MSEDLSLNNVFAAKEAAIKAVNECAQKIQGLQMHFLFLVELPTGEMIRTSLGMRDPDANSEMRKEAEEYLRFLLNRPDRN